MRTAEFHAYHDRLSALLFDTEAARSAGAPA
jgi:hypothetical protein